MTATDRAWASAPARRLEGELAVPGDKSISHRALLVAAVAQGTMAVEGCSLAADVLASLRAVEALGARVRPGADGGPPSLGQGELQRKTLAPGGAGRGFQILVDGSGWEGIRSPQAPIDVGNSGTTIRLLLGLLAPSDADATLTGDESIRRRPMGRVVEPLRRMGAVIEDADGGAPLRVRGAPLHGADHDLAVASAQVKSALLLAGLRASGTTSVREPGRSRDHTERLLRHLGIQIDQSSDRLIVKATEIRSAEVTVPGDLSSAAFFLVGAAILPGSHVVVRECGVNPTRAGILDLLRAYGADVAVTEVREQCGEPVGTISVRSGDRRPLDVAGDMALRSLDELPLVAVLGALADGGVTTVRDAAELRVKESDRIATIASALRRMGAEIETRADGFAVRGAGALAGGDVDPAGDHRVAMALAVAGLAAGGEALVRGWDCVAVSYPGFERDLERLVVR